MMKLDIAENNSLGTCCGVNDVGGFDLRDDDDYPVYSYHRARDEVEPSGTGIFVSAFINSKECKAAYAHLTKEHVLLYQSPKRKNNSSGRELFLCVFMHKDRARGLKKAEPVVVVREAAITPTFPFPQRKGEKLPTI